MLASDDAMRMNPASYAAGSPAVEALLSAMDILLGGPWAPEPEKDWQEEARHARAEIAARKEAAETARESAKGKTKKAAPRISQDEIAGYLTTTDDKLGWGNAWVRSNSLTKALEKRKGRKPIRVPAGCRPDRFQGFRRYQHDYATPAPERTQQEPTQEPDWLQPLEFDTSREADRHANFTHAYIIGTTPDRPRQ